MRRSLWLFYHENLFPAILLSIVSLRMTGACFAFLRLGELLGDSAFRQRYWSPLFQCGISEEQAEILPLRSRCEA